MGERLASLFDVTVETSLREVSGDDLDTHLDRYLKDAHALEQQAAQLLAVARKLVDDEDLKRIFTAHAEQTADHLDRVEERLRARGSGPSRPRTWRSAPAASTSAASSPPSRTRP